MRALYFALFLSLVAVGACSGADKMTPPDAPPVETPTTVPAAEVAATASAEGATNPAEPTDPGEGIAWKDKSDKQKGAHMNVNVLPTLKTLFQEHDGEAFEKFKCSTCHGRNARERGFEMPNPQLPKLDFTDGLKKHKERDPKMVEFMGKVVTPKMAALLDQKPYDPKTGEGFGCLGCHVQKKTTP